MGDDLRSAAHMRVIKERSITRGAILGRIADKALCNDKSLWRRES